MWAEPERGDLTVRIRAGLQRVRPPREAETDQELAAAQSGETRHLDRCVDWTARNLCQAYLSLHLERPGPASSQVHTGRGAGINEWICISFTSLSLSVSEWKAWRPPQTAITSASNSSLLSRAAGAVDGQLIIHPPRKGAI